MEMTFVKFASAVAPMYDRHPIIEFRLGFNPIFKIVKFMYPLNIVVKKTFPKNSSNAVKIWHTIGHKQISRECLRMQRMCLHYFHGARIFFTFVDNVKFVEKTILLIILVDYA